MSLKLGQRRSFSDGLRLPNTSGVAAKGIDFGGDVTLYRSAANVLKTDDAFSAEGTIRSNATTPFRWGVAGAEQTTVGAAGAASALPATPTKFLKVVDSAGTTLVIPAYAAS